MHAYAIGIDLGTTNTVVSVFRNGKKETLKIDGKYFLPSVVSYRKNQPAMVGHAAKNRMGVDPASTIASSKRDMGNSKKFYQLLGSTYSPVDIAAEILMRAKEGAKESLGTEIWDAVITVPAYFDERQKEDTCRAGEQAGLNVLRLLPEPSAAAISYAIDRSKEQTILIYDFGGGTFDVSILKVKCNELEVVAVGGDSQLGGDDIDSVILEWACDEFKKQTGINLLDKSVKEYVLALQRLREFVEMAKKELAEADSTEIIVTDLAGYPFVVELHISKFNELIKPILMKTIKCVHNTIRDAGLTVDDIDRVILVGGSTRIRAVRELVTQEIREPYSDEDPDQAVSWGAAIVAASFYDLDLPVVREKTAHTLGIGMWDNDRGYIFQPLISKNSTYPCRGGVLGVTSVEYQEDVRISVFRGEEPLADENVELGNITVPVKSPQKNRVPVAAVFNLDENGLLRFRAVDIPVDRLENSSVENFLMKALRGNNVIDIDQFDKLVKDNIIPSPEAVTITQV